MTFRLGTGAEIEEIFPVIPALRDDPKLVGRDDTKVVGDSIAKAVPFFITSSYKFKDGPVYVDDETAWRVDFLFATSMAKAIDVVRKTYPDCVIWDSAVIGEFNPGTPEANVLVRVQSRHARG
jgi:hypothetical protein